MRLNVLGASLAMMSQAVFATPLGERTLVVVDKNSVSQEAGAAAAESLRSRGHDVTVAGLKAAPALYTFGERSFDNLVIVPGKTKGLGHNLAAKQLVDFFNDGGNFVAVTTGDFSPAGLRDAAAQFGLTLGSKGTVFTDYFSGDGLIHIDESSFADSIFDFTEPLKVNNSGAGLLAHEGKFTIPFVRAPANSFAYNRLLDDGDDSGLITPFVAGSRGVLAAGSQGRNGARFAWLGSTDLLKSSYGDEILQWAFQERGVLRIRDVQHRDVTTGEEALLYRVNDELEYCASVDEWSAESSSWVPHTGATDIQLEFKMLDPYYRLNLVETTPGRYCVQFRAPDQYGMFTFLVDYLRPGKTFLHAANVVTLRPNANDEWARSWTITNSWVYLSGLTTIVFGFLIFVPTYLALPPLAQKKEVSSQK